MDKNPYLLLGVANDATSPEIVGQYEHIMAALDEAGHRQLHHQERMERAKECVVAAYHGGTAKDFRPTTTKTRGKSACERLGKFLVRTNVLSQKELEATLRIQKSSPTKLPLGSLLVSRGLLNWEQLAYYLKLQDLLDLSPDNESRLSRQLVDLGLLTEAELELVQFDCETCRCSLSHAIIRRGWIEEPLLEVLRGHRKTKVERHPKRALRKS